MILKRTGYFLFFAVTALVLSGCVFGDFVIKKDEDKVDASVPTSPMEDVGYASVLNKWMKSVQLYSGLELYFQGYAVLMSSEMKTAYQKRAIEIQGASANLDPHLFNSADTVSIFINSFSRNLSYREFDDDRVWNLSLYYHGLQLTHPVVYRYRNTAAIDPYFPRETVWSRAYAVVFTLPKDLDSKKKDDNKVIFYMKSGESKSEYTWDENVGDR